MAEGQRAGSQFSDEEVNANRQKNREDDGKSSGCLNAEDYCELFKRGYECKSKGNGRQTDSEADDPRTLVQVAEKRGNTAGQIVAFHRRDRMSTRLNSCLLSISY